MPYVRAQGVPWISKTVKILRWILVMPAGIGGFYLALIVTMAIQTAADNQCPLDYQVQGEVIYCLWPESVQVGFFAAGGALAAIFVVIFSTLIAPRHKKAVALIAYAGGAAVAATMVVALEETTMHVFVMLGATLTAGLITLICIFWFKSRAIEE